MTTPTFTEMVHTGIVVRELDGAMASIGAALGVRWATPQRRHLDGIGLDGPVVADVDITWSLEGPPHLELIAAGPGTLWTTSQESELHHVAFWSDDLAGDVERVRRTGSELELTGAAAGGAPSSFAYLRRPDGLRI